MTLFTRHDRMKQTKYSGAWRMPDSARSIKHARRLRAGNRWPARVHLVLTLTLVLSLLAILTGIYLSLLYSGRSDPARSEGCFTVAIWASCYFVLFVSLKCYMNLRHPKS